MNEEFNTLLAAYKDTHNKWMGAMSLYSAVYDHLGKVGQRAAEQHQNELQAAHQEASAALDAYHTRSAAPYIVVGEAYRIAA